VGFAKCSFDYTQVNRYNGDMKQADYIGTVPLEFIDLSETKWCATLMDDIFQERYITQPTNYLFTLGSGVASHMVSLATTPSYHIPTSSQIYLAGRDVFRWGGPDDPYEIDIDRYGFTPDYSHGAAIMWRAPKSEPHHLSRLPQLNINIRVCA
jgi:hypothetical protein